MVAIVEQTFCNVHRSNPSALIFESVEYKFMHANAFDWQFVVVLQAFLNIVCIECSVRTHHLQVLLAQCQDVSISAQRHKEVAHKLANVHIVEVVFSSCFWQIKVETCICFHNVWLWQELYKVCSYTNRTATRTATAVRSRESLVDIDVHYIKSHIARTCNTQQWVKVCSIVIHQTATLVNHFGNLGNVLFKQAECVRIGHHHTCYIVAKQWFQVFNIDKTISCALNFYYIKPTNCCRSWVCTVGRVWNDNLLTLRVTAFFVIRADNHKTCKLSLCTCKWVYGEVSKTRNA